jgi:hypothetical protein
VTISIIVVISLFDALGSSPQLPQSCRSIVSSSFSYAFPDKTYVCGQSSASDGRLKITVHNYHFANGSQIDFIFPPSNFANKSYSQSGLFLLVNSTVQNVGDGNTSIGPFYVVISNGGSEIGNSEYMANAKFPNEFPNQTIPSTNGGLYLPPGSKADLWLIFYVPTSNVNSISNLKLQYLLFQETIYGGAYRGGGAYDCPCGNPNIEFIIKV